MATSEQLEHKVDATRNNIEETLTELRARLSPGKLMDDALGFAKENGGADLVRNLGHEISANPLPVALMGAALAWMMIGQSRRDTNGGPRRRLNFNEWAERTEAMSDFENKRRTGEMNDGASDKSGGYYEMASGAAGTARDRAADVYGKARDTTSDMMERAKETTAGAYERARGAASSVSRSMSSAMDGTRGISKFMQEQPIVLAGIGVALGAVIGALLPSTETEERYLGPTAGALKENAKDMAREQWERGKELAEEGWDEAKEAARRTWEDAKQEANTAWQDTRQKAADSGSSGQTADLTGTRTPLVPSEQEENAERLADATERNTRPGV